MGKSKNSFAKTKGSFAKTKGSFAKTKKSSRNQKIYKMKGCSKTRKNYLGGSPDAPLAYTGEPTFFIRNPALAYTGKGGASCGLSNTANIPVNTNAANPAYPNTGPISDGVDTIYNNASPQLGGCGCAAPLVGGGRRRRKGCSCPLCSGGKKQHRIACKCSECKSLGVMKGGVMKGGVMKGGVMKGGVMKGGNVGIPYPDGLVGTAWKPNIDSWPGVNGVPGDSNYYPVNNYNNDISRQMVDVGANPPFLNMKGGKQKQKGGFLGQDLINLGRQFQFGVGSAYNALAGYPAPTNPMPWKGQFQTNMDINLAKI
jgi:hypothetical protein